MSSKARAIDYFCDGYTRVDFTAADEARIAAQPGAHLIWGLDWRHRFKRAGCVNDPQHCCGDACVRGVGVLSFAKFVG